MHWLVSLYNLAPGADAEEYLRLERRVSARYTEYRAGQGRFYLGLYAADSRKRGAAPVPWQDLPYAYAEVSVVDDESPAAIAAQRAPQPPPPDIQEMAAAARALGGGDSARIALWPIVSAPFAYTPLVFADKMLRVSLFEPGPGKTEADLAAFERRINMRYSEFESRHDWYYTGTYRVQELPGFTWGEVDAVGGASPEEALARDAAMAVPPDVQAIYEECRTYISRERPRTALWLTPLVPSPIAAQGLVLIGKGENPR